MKQINIYLCLVLSLAVLFSCSKGFINYNQNGNWVGRAPYAGIPIGEGTSFAIGQYRLCRDRPQPANA